MKENFKPSEIEEFHAKLMNLFHVVRLQKGDNPDKTLTLDGNEFSNIIALAKKMSYHETKIELEKFLINKPKLI